MEIRGRPHTITRMRIPAVVLALAVLGTAGAWVLAGRLLATVAGNANALTQR